MVAAIVFAKAAETAAFVESSLNCAATLAAASESIVKLKAPSTVGSAVGAGVGKAVGFGVGDLVQVVSAAYILYAASPRCPAQVAADISALIISFVALS
jgi:hypothetical protein